MNQLRSNKNTVLSLKHHIRFLLSRKYREEWDRKYEDLLENGSEQDRLKFLEVIR